MVLLTMVSSPTGKPSASPAPDAAEADREATGARPVRRGFSLLEVGVILLVLGGISAFWFPRRVAEDIEANEASAIATLEHIAQAQEDFLKHTEGQTYGLLSELAGFAPKRGIWLDDPLLDTGPLEYELWKKDGYRFVIWLVGARGEAVHRTGEVHPKWTDRFWVAYAWPVAYGISGRRVFGIARGGGVHAMTNDVKPFGGLKDIPPATLMGKHLPEHPFGNPPPWIARIPWRTDPQAP